MKQSDLRVFSVEGMREMRQLLDDLLASLGGFRLVGVAESEHEAIQWVKDHRGHFDLAVLDLVLSEGSGLSVIGRCKEAGATVVVMSSYATPGIREHCMRQGPSEVFSKHGTGDFIAFCTQLATSTGRRSRRSRADGFGRCGLVPRRSLDARVPVGLVDRDPEVVDLAHLLAQLVVVDGLADHAVGAGLVATVQFLLL